MAAVPLFKDTNMAAVTSRKNTLYRVFQKFVDILKSIHPDFLYFSPICYRHQKIFLFIDFQNCSMSRKKNLVEINIFPPKGANLCRVFLHFPAIIVCFQ